MTAVVAPTVFSARLKCGGKQRDGSAEGSGLLHVSALSTPTINKEALASGSLHENAQVCLERKGSGAVHLTPKRSKEMSA